MSNNHWRDSYCISSIINSGSIILVEAAVAVVVIIIEVTVTLIDVVVVV